MAVKPALTKEEWAAKAVTSRYGDGLDSIGLDRYGRWIVWEAAPLGRGVGDERIFTRRGERGRVSHALAALALRGQPFGFTREMVDALVSGLEVAGNEGWGSYSWSEEQGKLAEAAIENIRALLPPEDK